MIKYKKITSTVLLALSLNLTGCSWFSSDSSTKIAMNIPAELKPFNAEFTPSKVWQSTVGSSNEFNFSPAMNENNQIFVVNADGDLASINKDSGQKSWIINTKEKISAGVGVGEDTVLIGTLKGKVIAFDYNGQKKWESQLSAEVLGVPVISNGVGLIRTADNSIYAIDISNGNNKWVYKRATVPSLTLRNQAGLIATRGAVFAGFAGGKMVALTLDAGNIGWEANVSLPKGFSEIERINDVTSTPIVDDQMACAVAYQGKLTCFELQGGNTIWSRDISSISGMTADQRLIYIADSNGVVWALDKKSGATIWKQTGLQHRNLSTPILVNGLVVVGDSQGYLHWLRIEDGSFSARIQAENSAINPDLKLISPTEFLVQTKTSSVYLIRN